ncbi:helix-turn-helix transcriptional regulator [Spirosoma fluminis]
MTINDKIKQILIDKNLTPSYFADEIGVQRSSISHILSGRNRPSFDIIQKIIRRFPELGYEWIMEEEPQLVNQPSHTNRFAGRPASDRFNTSPTSYIPPAPTIIRSQRNEIPPVAPPHQEIQPAPQPTPVANMADKKIERILIFYTDGSFREYSPAS